MEVIQYIIKNKLFKIKPIVLMHIGSAGSNFVNWKNISSSSILISVDGNEAAKNKNHMFLKEINDNSIISNKNGYSSFYITKDSHCSSLLKPQMKNIRDWYLAHRFKVKKKINVKTISFNNFLKKQKIKYIDWLVIDAQGMDLKILKSLNKNIRDKISIIDIEPGFFNFYDNESSISEIFKYMNSNKFEFSEMKFGNNYKVSSKNLSNFEKKVLFSNSKPSKNYSNITFQNQRKFERANLIKTIYLINQNKIFEAKHHVSKNFLDIKIKKNLLLKINKEVAKEKFKFFFIIPFLIIKKIFKKLCL
jgi:FkbM family methyltransferase